MDFDIGNIVSGALGYLGSQSTNDTQMAIAQQANAFSAQQFANRYQTTVKDMEAAGLSPMLAYGQGGGSPPTGQQAQVQNPMASAIQAYHQSAERKVMESEIRQRNAASSDLEASAKLKEEQAKLAAQQTIESRSKERQADVSANEATLRQFSQSTVTNPTQKALAASYWSQVDVNKANLPKIASEIVSNGAFAAQARAQAFKAIQEGKITQQDYQRAVNEADFERSAVGKSKRYIDYGINSAGKIKDLLPSKSTTVRETPWGNSKSTTYSR